MESLKLKASTLAALLVAASSALPGPARADCGADLQHLKQRLKEVSDRARREEAAKLIAKAEKDERSGRAARCADAAARAATLLKPRPAKTPPS
jgi:hypothetical protein